MRLIDMTRHAELVAELCAELAVPTIDRPKVNGRHLDDTQIRGRFAVVVARDAFMFLVNPANYKELKSMCADMVTVDAYKGTSQDTRLPAVLSRCIGIALAGIPVSKLSLIHI